MSDSKFLDDLKNAVNSGEFNSEAAKKILEVNRLADEKMKDLTRIDEETVQSKSVDKRLEDAGIRKVSKEKADEINALGIKKMAELEKKQFNDDRMLVLIDIENMVKLSIEDMMGFINETEGFLEEKFDNEDPTFNDLKAKIAEIKTKYSTNN